jgi:UDP-N-acetylglucosamine pyrophosphorylase
MSPMPGPLLEILNLSMDTTSNQFSEFETKMRMAGVRETAIRAFRHSYRSLLGGDTGLIAEDSIQSVSDLPHLEQLEAEAHPHVNLLSEAVVIKLNGGLGTGMGLEGAKSLLKVKNRLTFLDFIVRQVLHLREEHQLPLTFVLMNSYSTSSDTLDFLRSYPELGEPDRLELMQSQVPKVDAQTLRPVSWPANPQFEWCPPGHGDIYPSLLGAGLLEKWLTEGKKYLFVSNSDNLGASLDLRILSYFAASGKPFLMEVAERTTSDSKGGHLARRDERLLLRESAQCPPADQPAFQDIRKHRFFNTNNLWIRLDSLKEILRMHDGFIPLPLIKNQKTVDPRDRNSRPVFQLETAMGAAIQCFTNAGALVVPRKRFAPVKTTSDLLALRSDAYRVTEDWRLILERPDGQPPPAIDLDPNYYKLVDQLDEKLVGGVPSLKNCQQLTIRGPVSFNAANVFQGKVSITNPSSEPLQLPAGIYSGCSKILA